MTNLINLYKDDLIRNKVLYDKAQENVVIELNDLSERLKIKIEQKENIFFSDIFSFFKKDDNRGLYIWGDVGRGKTYLVDLFFSSLPFQKKIRLHFHHFMKFIHDSLKFHYGKKDPLRVIAKDFCKDFLVLCLDEFFVKDIGDAMSLSKLFDYLFDFGLFIVITSNVVPHKLYEGGLQRQKFMSTIRVFEKSLKIINIDSSIDYRFMHLQKECIFFYSLTFSTFKLMKKLFFKLSNSNFKRKVFISLVGRKVFTYYLSDNIIWVGFNHICGFGRSHIDYIEIASLFKIVFISGIKQFNNNDDEARRFIALIDEFYDRRVKVIISFDSDISNLYNGELLKFDFKRTISRLTEMSTKNYLKDLNNNVK